MRGVDPLPLPRPYRQDHPALPGVEHGRGYTRDVRLIHDATAESLPGGLEPTVDGLVQGEARTLQAQGEDLSAQLGHLGRGQGHLGRFWDGARILDLHRVCPEHPFPGDAHVGRVREVDDGRQSGAVDLVVVLPVACVEPGLTGERIAIMGKDGGKMDSGGGISG